MGFVILCWFVNNMKCREPAHLGILRIRVYFPAVDNPTNYMDIRPIGWPTDRLGLLELNSALIGKRKFGTRNTPDLVLRFKKFGIARLLDFGNPDLYNFIIDSDLIVWWSITSNTCLSTQPPAVGQTHQSSVQYRLTRIMKGKEKKGKLGAHAIKRVAASGHPRTPWLFEPAKLPDDKADYCLGTRQ